MLHCNMNFVWQASHASVVQNFFQPCGVIKLDGCHSSERLQRADEIPRSRHGEMRRQRRAVGPLLDEHQPQRILAIGMHGRGDTSRLVAGAVDMLET
jgi:hypothetical protein